MQEPRKTYISRLKQDFLFERGFKFNLRRQIFILRKEKIVMSFEFVAAYNLDIIKRVFNLREKSGDYWTLHFIEKPSPKFRKQLIEKFEE